MPADASKTQDVLSLALLDSANIPSSLEEQMGLTVKIIARAMEAKSLKELEAYIGLAMPMMPKPRGLIARTLLNVSGLSNEKIIDFMMVSRHLNTVMGWMAPEDYDDPLKRNSMEEEEKELNLGLLNNFEELESDTLIKMFDNYGNDNNIYKLSKGQAEHILGATSGRIWRLLWIYNRDPQLVSELSEKTKALVSAGLGKKEGDPANLLEIYYYLGQGKDPLAQWMGADIKNLDEVERADLLYLALTERGAKGRTKIYKERLKKILGAGSVAKIVQSGKVPETVWDGLNRDAWGVFAEELVRKGYSDVLKNSFDTENKSEPWRGIEQGIKGVIALKEVAQLKEKREELAQALITALDTLPRSSDDVVMETEIYDLQRYLGLIQRVSEREKLILSLAEWKETDSGLPTEIWKRLAGLLAEHNSYFFREALGVESAILETADVKKNLGPMLARTRADRRIDIVRRIAALALSPKGRSASWIGQDILGQEKEEDGADILAESEADDDQDIKAEDQDTSDKNKERALAALFDKVPHWKETAAKYPRLAFLLPDAVAYGVATGIWRLQEGDLVGIKEKDILAQVFMAGAWMRTALPAADLWTQSVDTQKRGEMLQKMSVSPGLKWWLQQEEKITGNDLVVFADAPVAPGNENRGGEEQEADDDLQDLENLGPALASLEAREKESRSNLEDDAPPVLNAAGYWFGSDRKISQDGLRTASLAVRLYLLGDRFTPEYARAIEQKPLFRKLFLSLLVQANPEAALAFLASPEASLKLLANKQAWEEEKKDNESWTQGKRVGRRAGIAQAMTEGKETDINWAVWYQALQRLSDARKHNPERFAQLKSFARMMEVAEDWHKEFGSMSVVSAAERAWPSFGRFPVPVIPGYEDEKYQFVHLGDSVQIAEEGAAMAHCVGTYRTQGMEGSSILYSVRQDGERLATVDLGEDGEIVQIYGYKDSLLPYEQEADIRRIYKHLVGDATRRRAVMARAMSEDQAKEGLIDTWIESMVQGPRPLEIIDKELGVLDKPGYEASRKRLAARAALTRHEAVDREWLGKARPNLPGRLVGIRQEVKREMQQVLAEHGLRAAREVVKSKLPAEATVFDALLLSLARARDAQDPGIDFLLTRRPELSRTEDEESIKRSGQFAEGDRLIPNVPSPEEIRSKIAMTQKTESAGDKRGGGVKAAGRKRQG